MSEKETEYALDILHGILPTIEQMAKDMMGIIRCKDCKWMKHDVDGKPFCEEWDDCFTEENGFCHRGERRGKEDE